MADDNYNIDDNPFDDEEIDNDLEEIIEDDEMDDEKKEELSDNEDDIEEDIMDEEEIEVMQIQINESDLANRVPDNVRQTYNLLTKFEITRIISTRAEQIARGSAPTIQTNLTVPIEIAEEELNQKKIPIIIRRPIGEGNDKKYEEWDTKDLIN